MVDTRSPFVWQLPLQFMNRTFTLKEIHAVAKDFLQEIKGASVVAFHGNLGAGKTTFIQALCTVKEVKEPVSSPTFSIINEYSNGQENIFHIDLYRLRGEQEALQAGVEECLYSGALCLVEWPERAPALLPEGTVHVYLEAAGQFARHIVIRDN